MEPDTIQTVPSFASESFENNKLKKDYMFEEPISSQAPDEFTTTLETL